VSGIVSVLLAKTLRSWTFRLALIWIALFGAIVIALFSYVYASTASYLRSRLDRAIAAEQAVLQKAYDDSGRGGLVVNMTGRLIAEARVDGSLYLLADPAFARIAGNLETWPPALAGAAGWGYFTAPEAKPSAAERPLIRATFATLPDGSHLLVGKGIDDLGEFEKKISIAMACALALIFVLAAAASVSVTRRTVARIEAINATSRAIMQSGLGRRIPLRGTRDEWDELAANLNSMLDRIEALMGEVKQFTDNVAHDLRTPLTRMRGRLEKACGGERDHGPIADTIAELDDVLRMFSSLTRISQVEANDRTAAFRAVDLAEIAQEVVELYDAAAEDRGGNLAVVGDERVVVTGDRDLLFDALANLVDNAIKHGRDAGRITVAARQNGSGAVLSVADDGPGIPADEHQHVFKRFYRIERSRRTPGNGLGLSLVAAVARLHGARIEMVDTAPGLEFRLCFP
jgi:signal transduction histidine kinase